MNELSKTVTGKFNARISKATINRNEWGQRKVTLEMDIVEGEHQGNTVTKVYHLHSASAFKFAQMEWERFGLKLNSIDEIDEVSLNKLITAAVDMNIAVRDGKRTVFLNKPSDCIGGHITRAKIDSLSRKSAVKEKLQSVVSDVQWILDNFDWKEKGEI